MTLEEKIAYINDALTKGALIELPDEFHCYVGRIEDHQVYASFAPAFSYGEIGDRYGVSLKSLDGMYEQAVKYLNKPS